MNRFRNQWFPFLLQKSTNRPWTHFILWGSVCPPHTCLCSIDWYAVLVFFLYSTWDTQWRFVEELNSQIILRLKDRYRLMPTMLQYCLFCRTKNQQLVAALGLLFLSLQSSHLQSLRAGDLSVIFCCLDSSLSNVLLCGQVNVPSLFQEFINLTAASSNLIQYKLFRTGSPITPCGLHYVLSYHR